MRDRKCKLFLRTKKCPPTLIRSGFRCNGFNSMCHSRLILSDCQCDLRPHHARLPSIFVIHGSQVLLCVSAVRFLSPQMQGFFEDENMSTNSCGTFWRPSFFAPKVVPNWVPNLGFEIWFAEGHVCMRWGVVGCSCGVFCGSASMHLCWFIVDKV